MFEYLKVECARLALRGESIILTINPLPNEFFSWSNKAYNVEFLNWLGEKEWELVSELAMATNVNGEHYHFPARFTATFKRRIKEI